MAERHTQHHDYHLVDPSPWPAVGSLSVFIAAVGGISWMHHMFAAAPFIFGVGVIGILYTFIGWWRDVVKEAQYEGFHTRVVQISHRYGMILFIASEVMFFVAWFWAYFNTALFPDAAPDVARVAFTGGVWPPKGIETFDPWHLPLLNTLILLTSGTTVTWAHHALLEDDRQGLKWGLILTIALGITFTCVQAWEYSHAAFNFKGNIYGATFFMATGFHGAHVIIGTIFLTVCLMRALAGHFSPKQHLGFEFAAWYWHFVDVVWLFLFACIYVWGAGGEHVAAAPRSEIAQNEVQATTATGAPAADAQSFERLLATASPERGAQVVKQCQICHNTQEGQGAKVGPDLYGVVDRPVASVPGFNYTPALKAKGGKWTFDALNKWITNPRADVPGTSMTFAGLSNEKQRADLIAYLDTLSKNPVPLPKAQSQK